MYCKYESNPTQNRLEEGINSSKVYCKFSKIIRIIHNYIVLIVAKCIVNAPFELVKYNLFIVLIVAKCIVNELSASDSPSNWKVLIVAKCIVNIFYL